MARLPTIGADDNTWGEVLNDFLTVSHQNNGTLKEEVFSTTGNVLANEVNNKIELSLNWDGVFADSSIIPNIPNAVATRAYVANAIATALTNLNIVPGAPTAVSATAANASAVITFSAPSSSGASPITGYAVTSIPVGGTDTNAGSTSLSHTVTGLTNGISYTFTVIATNNNGSSAVSNLSNAVTPTVSTPQYVGTENYGDSITYGQGASSYSAAWASLLNTRIGGSNINHGIPGHRSGNQLAALLENVPAVNRQSLVTWAVGINDDRGSYDPQTEWCVRAFLTQVFRNTSIPASDNSIVKTGSWTVASQKYNAKNYPLESTTLNAEATYTFTGTSGYVTIIHQGNNAGLPGILACYQVFIDNVLVTGGLGGNTGFTGNGYGGLNNGNLTYSLPYLFTNLSNTFHTIRVVNYGDYGNATGRIVWIDEFGTLKNPSQTVGATVSAIYPHDHAQHGGNTSLLASKNQAIENVVNEFIMKGYPAKYVNFIEYTGVTAQTADGLHPNDSGHLKIYTDYVRILGL